jgi:hypothetical protein
MLLATILLVGMTASTALASERRVVVLTTVLTGEAEVPGPGDPDAIGAAVVVILPRSDVVCWALTWKRVTETVHMAHIHGPADIDESAGILIEFFMGQSFAGRGFHSGCTRSEFADDIAADPSQYYVNVHALPDFGPGAIRGQLR